MWRIAVLILIALPATSFADQAATMDIDLVVTDQETGNPVRGANVQCVSFVGVKASTSNKTDADGKVSLKMAWTEESVSGLAVRASGYHPFHAALDAAQKHEQPKRIVLRRGKVLRGQIVDSGGNPIPGARVTTTDAADESIRGYFYSLFSLETDKDGRFRFDAIDPGSDLRLEISHPEFKTRWVPSDLSGEMQIHLAKEQHVAGLIRDFRGQPLVDATVVSVAGNVQSLSDSDGKFDLGMVSCTPLQIVVTADQASPQLVNVDDVADASQLTVRMLPGRTIRLRLTNESGDGVSGVQIASRLWRNTAALRLSTVTDERGLATLRNAPADVVDYEFRHSGYATKTVRLKSESRIHEIKLVDLESPNDVVADAAPEAPGLASENLDVDPANPERRILHLCDINGTVLRPLISDVKLRHRLDRHGTPDVSQDGSTIAYDAWDTSKGEDWEDARIVVANMDGSNARDIGFGVIPSLSPNGSHVVFSRPRKHAPADGAQGQSIWTMKTDGTNKKMIADNYAWGARWTADGRSIVFRRGNDDDGNYVSGNCIRVFDLQSEKTRNVFSPEESPFTSLKFQLNVSRRSRLAIVKGTLRDGGGAAAVIDIDRGLDSIGIIKLKDAKRPNFNISSGGVSSLSHDDQWFATASRSKGRLVGHAIHVDELLQPRLFKNFPPDLTIVDPTYTPDGKHLIVSIGMQ